MMSRFLSLAALAVLGGLLFWGGDALLMLIGGGWQAPYWIIAKSVTLPVLCGLTFWMLVWRFAPGRRITSWAVAMALGIWLSGPVYFLLFLTTAGGHPLSVGEALFHLLLFPLSTPLVALFNGSFGGLLLTTVLLALFATGWLGTGRRP